MEDGIGEMDEIKRGIERRDRLCQIQNNEGGLPYIGSVSFPKTK